MPKYLDGAGPRPRVRPEGEVGDGLATVERRRHRAVPTKLDRGGALGYPPGRLADDLRKHRYIYMYRNIDVRART